MATIAFHRGRDFLFGKLYVLAGQNRFSLKRGETKTMDLPDGACKIIVGGVPSKFFIDGKSVSSKLVADIQGDCMVTISSFLPYIQIIGCSVLSIALILSVFHLVSQWILDIGWIVFLFSLLYLFAKRKHYFKIILKHNTHNIND
jgi:hypothetical protein